MAQPVRYQRTVESTLASEAFAEFFGRHLVLFHMLAGDTLTKRAFEAGIAIAVKGTGRRVQMPSSPTNPGHDILIDDEPWSLKTEGSAGIKPNSIVISKLMECAWTKDITTREELVANLYRVRAHLDRYQRILTLRSFRTTWPDPALGDEAVRYDLVEIPTALFDGIDRLRPSDFSEMTAKGSCSAPIRVNGEKALTLAFDGSDNKVTVRGLLVSHCFTHVSFWVPPPDAL